MDNWITFPYKQNLLCKDLKYLENIIPNVVYLNILFITKLKLFQIDDFSI